MEINLEEIATAFHEAGHAFMSELVGWKYEYVEINGHEGGLFGCVERTNTMLDKLILACICLSGGITEVLYLLFSRDLGDSGDIAENLYQFSVAPDFVLVLYGAFTCNVGGGDRDLSKYLEIGLCEGFLKPLIEFTGKIIIDNWYMVSTIANSLAEHKRLTYEEVKRLLGDFELRELRKKYAVYISELRAISPEG
jgi:hypothetical protein